MQALLLLLSLATPVTWAVWSSKVKASFSCQCPNPERIKGRTPGLKFYFKQSPTTGGNFGELLAAECEHICSQAAKRRRRKRQLFPMVGFTSCLCDELCTFGGCSYDCAPPAPLVLDAPSPLWALAPHQRRAPIAFPTFWRR